MTTETAVGYVRLSQQSDRSLAAQREAIRNYCNRSQLSLVELFNDGEGASGYDNDREQYGKLLSYVEEHEVSAVVVRDLSRLSRDRKERMRLLLDLDASGVALHSVEQGQAVDLDEDWAFVHQSIRATTDDVEKRKEIERSKRATQERINNGYDHGRPPFGLVYDDDGHYWVPDHDSDEYQTAVTCIQLRDDGCSWREIASEIDVSKDTASRIYERRERYLPTNEERK